MNAPSRWRYKRQAPVTSNHSSQTSQWNQATWRYAEKGSNQLLKILKKSFVSENFLKDFYRRKTSSWVSKILRLWRWERRLRKSREETRKTGSRCLFVIIVLHILPNWKCTQATSRRICLHTRSSVLVLISPGKDVESCVAAACASFNRYLQRFCAVRSSI